MMFCEMDKSIFLKIVNRLKSAKDACFEIHFCVGYQLPFLNKVMPKYLNESTSSTAVLYI